MNSADRAFAWTKKIFDEAYAVDPVHTREVTHAVLGVEVFTAEGTPVAQLRELSARLFATARLTVGV